MADAGAPGGLLDCVVDAHLHFWDTARFSYPWLYGELDRSFLPSDLELGRSGVQGAVFVQADCVPADAFHEIRWASSLAPFILGVVAYAPVEVRDILPSWLESLSDFPLVRGIRRNLQSEPPSFFDNPDLVRGLTEIASRGLSFDACVTWRQLALLPALLAMVPSLDVVLDHLGKPPIGSRWGSQSATEWHRSIREIAKFERVAVKLSGLAPESKPGQDLSVEARPFLEAALDAFGPRRCMAGSDWPVSSVVRGPRSYDSWFEIALDGLSLDERAAVGFATASSAYRLNISKSPADD